LPPEGIGKAYVLSRKIDFLLIAQTAEFPSGPVRRVISVDLRLEAMLFGGAADGYRIELDQLYPKVTIFQNGGRPFALQGAVPGRPDAMRLGVYDFVRPSGPDTPVYVSSGI
jgi:hypothetical protein